MNAAHGHLPTRACPHRHCALLHHLVLVLLLPSLLAAVVYGGSATAVLLVLLGGIQLGVVLLTHALDPNGPHRPWDHRSLTLRPMWAALAIAADFLALLATCAFMATLAVDRSHAAVPAPTPGAFTAIGAVSALLALHHVAHRRATVLTEPVAADDAEHDDDDWWGESFIWEHGDMAEYRR
ncbi:hypothetical protein ACFW6N_32610 [Streptomyces cyaneofuscatus]|uniref:hypothetical protein n=1 Tax=Streptomyces cyaneofuscatus TaxID=66883 RepID=UPI003683E6B2